MRICIKTAINQWNNEEKKRSTRFSKGLKVEECLNDVHRLTLEND